MCQFLKLPYSDMKLCNWPKFQKLPIYYLNYSTIPNSTPFCSTVANFGAIEVFRFNGYSGKFEIFGKKNGQMIYNYQIINISNIDIYNFVLK